MALSINTYSNLLPKIVNDEARATVVLPALDSSVHWIGGLVSLRGTDTAAPAGPEFGVPTYADDQFIYGIVVAFLDRNGAPIQNGDITGQGTLVNATGYLPAKYTFSATNEESNASPKGEMLEILPIKADDILEMALWGASTAPVKRGTTTAAGTTASSANFGVSLAVNATYPFSLLESTAVVAEANMDFKTVRYFNRHPVNAYKVFVQGIRLASQVIAPN